MNKTFTLADFLTSKQINEAKKIYDKLDSPAKEICQKIIQPNIADINKKLGQENDPMYLAYVCEYVFEQAKYVFEQAKKVH